ncbi:glycosyltransferase family 92 protein [Pseudomonas sp. ODNR1LW]|nr:glycosyltransferase family 92 protein [Pseudomonas sp. ODNR1LW]
MKIAVCAICRNEVDYVEEWISYYKVSGFDSVFIYDNVSDDGTSELLSALHDVGEITRVHWPRREGIPPQRDAYGHFIENFSAAFDYVLICDLDEFLVVNNTTIKALLAEAECQHENVGAIAFPWLVFGSGGSNFLMPGLVIDRFKKCEKKASPVVKTMFSPKNTYNMRTHICDLLSGVYLDNTLAVADWNQTMPIKLKSSSMGRAVIHHYYTKSREEWIKRRSLPKADRANQELKNIAEFDKYHNQTCEHSAADMKVLAVQSHMKETREKLEGFKLRVSDVGIELVSVNKDWVFGLVRFQDRNSIKTIRMLSASQKETTVNTRLSAENVQVFTIKTKWRDTFSEDFSLSIVGSSFSRFFTKLDWPSSDRSLEMLAKYCPEAEEHIFTIFIDTLEKEPSPDVIKMMCALNFAKYKKYKDFIIAIDAHIKAPKDGHLKRFSTVCDEDFLKQVADVKNKRRKFVVKAING